MDKPDRSSTFDLDAARAFVAQVSVSFTYAKSVPDAPHTYLVRARLEPELQVAFDRFVALIERDGYTGRFGQQTWRYLDLDGRAYWPSKSWFGPDAGKPATMLNRRRLDTTPTTTVPEPAAVPEQLNLEDAS